MSPAQVLTLAMLALTWLGIAMPLALRNREESVAGQVTGFHRALSVLDPTPKAPIVTAHSTPPGRSAGTNDEHLATLRRVLLAAVAATVLSLAGAVVWQGVFVPAAAISVIGTIAYVGLLRRRKVEQDRARAVITSMRSHAGMAPRGQSRQAAPMPMAVGHRGDADWDAHAARGDEQPGRRGDVRVLSEPEIRAHDGFDVLI